MSEEVPNFDGVFGLKDPRNQMIYDLAALIHQDEWLEAGSYYAAYVRRTKDANFKNPETKDHVVALVTQLVHWCLNHDRYALAARLLWTENLFDARPHFTQIIWETLKKSASTMLMGSASASKSYSTGVWLLMDWIRDPENTSVKLLGPSEKHLSENLFTHIVNLHQSASIPLPGTTGDLWIGMDRKNKFGSISGVVVPLGKKAAGRLQGTKAGKRKNPHPLFGPERRLRVFMDESEKIPKGIWRDVDNIFSNLNGIETFKIICAFNPEDQNGESGTRCEPVGGWESFDIDKDELWRSRRGWDVVRLDGFKNENIIYKQTIFSGLQTWESITRLIENAGGYQSSGYHCADEETEVLSRRGWLTHTQVRVGDRIYTVNPVSGLAEWETVEEVFSKPYSGKLVSLEGRGFSALVTSNHRWAVTKKKRPRLEFKETKDLTAHDNIPLCRPAASFGKEDCVDLASTVGWVVTDGTLGKGEKRVAIYQSHAVNPEKCREIRNLLSRNTKFSESPRADGMTTFRFSGDFAAKVRSIVTDDKVVTMDFIESLTERAMRALWAALVKGDGFFNGGSNECVCTSREEQAGIYSALSVRLGRSTSTYFRPECGKGSIFPTGYVSRGRDMWYVQARLSAHTRPQNLDISVVKYAGNVWCPRTKNGTFFARRKGTTYFTGNTMARACFPPRSVQQTVIPQGMAEGMKGTFVFISKTTPAAGCDLALEGGDAAPFAMGEFGYATGFRKFPTPQHPNGEYLAFRDDTGAQIVRPAIQVTQIFKLDRGDSVFMANQIKNLCGKLAISPKWLCIDRTGAGQGVFDILRTSWSPDVIGTNYSESASERKILEEDMKTCKEEYERVLSELWFATRKWGEFHLLKLSAVVDFTTLFPQLTGRQFDAKKISRVESKKEYMSRNAGRSPDEADALTLLVHAVRTASGEVPSLRVDKSAGTSRPEEREYNSEDDYRVDSTNKAPRDLDE